MAALTRAGGVDARVDRDENVISPTFLFKDVPAAAAFAPALPDHFETFKAEAESTTRHGRLLRLEPGPWAARSPSTSSTGRATRTA